MCLGFVCLYVGYVNSSGSHVEFGQVLPIAEFVKNSFSVVILRTAVRAYGIHVRCIATLQSAIVNDSDGCAVHL